MSQPTKLFGTYPQTQQGLYMQRIPIFAGRITTETLFTLAGLPIRYTAGTPLHLTTRQNIELHNVPEALLSQLHQDIATLGISTFGAGGDSLRNTVICPCCRYSSDSFDPFLLAETVQQVLNNSGVLTQLPRKFKLSFAGCAMPQSKPFIADLAFVLTSPEKAWVVGAGSLGASPVPGIVLYDELPVEEIPALALGALQLFAEHGDRENRKKARLRHIRQKMGNDLFRTVLSDYFQRALQQVGPIHSSITAGPSGYRKIATIQTIGGDIAPKHVMELCTVVKNAGGEIQINLNQGFDVYAKSDISFPLSLRQYIGLPTIISCPGNTTCKNGLVNSPAHVKELYTILGGHAGLKGKVIALSGCPNNCMHSCVSDIGLVGRLKTTQTGKHQAYTLYTGGDNGLSGILAEQKDIIIADELADKIGKLANAGE